MNCKQHASQLTIKLRQNKLKATPGRLELLDIFEHAKKPLSVGELAEKLPTSDKATLYRNVESLETLGLLKQIRFKDRQAYYETASHHHHHVICTICSKIVDVKNCTIPISKKEFLQGAGFTEIGDHSLEFYGVCNSCAKNKRS